MKKREKNTKKPKPINFSGLESKIRSPYNDKQMILSWRQKGHGSKVRDHLKQELIIWMQEPTSLSMGQFYLSYGMPEQTFYDHLNADEELKYLWQIAKEFVGERQLKAARHKEYNCNPDVITKTLHEYHPDWRDTIESEKEFKLKMATIKDQEKNSGPITIVLPDQSKIVHDKE